jgi:predicted nuclease of predicted toxin-antitoxin system
MEILLDHNVARKLRRYLSPHRVSLTVEMGWNELSNGELLKEAQRRFDVLITTDSNLYHQNKVARFDIAVIVLRAFSNRYVHLVKLMPEALEVIEIIQPGQVIYLYADQKLALADERKGKSGPRRIKGKNGPET